MQLGGSATMKMFRHILFAVVQATVAFSALAADQSQLPDAALGVREILTGPANTTQKIAPVPNGASVVRTRGVGVDLIVLDETRDAVQAPGAAEVYVRTSLFEDAIWILELRAVERTQSGGYALVGRVAGIPHSTVVIVNNGDAVSMQIQALSQKYVVEGGKAGGYTVSQMGDSGRRDHPREPDAVNAPPLVVPGTRLVGADTIEQIQIARDSGAEIDVMIVYTPAARVQNGGTPQIGANIDAQIALTNLIYSNSGVVQRLRLVYKGEVTYTEVNMDTDLPRLYNTTDGFLDEVPVLRDIYRADIVSFWGVYSDYCGLGSLMATESSGFATRAYNIVASPACTAANSYTFAHELGHNMGLRHDNFVDSRSTSVSPEAGGANATVAYAHGYIDLVNRFRTVMSYNDQCVAQGYNCTRIPHVSNPSVSYTNSAGYAAAVLAPTGNAANAHERQALNDTRETTANFRQALASFTGPGVISFLPPNYTVSEGTATVQLIAGRNAGSTGVVSVTYSTANGTAIAGADYQASSGTLTWADGDVTTRSIVVTILQDSLIEGSESFSVALGAPTGGATLQAGASAATVLILDDEVDTVFPANGVFPSAYSTPAGSGGAWTVALNEGYLSNYSLRSAQVYSAANDFTNYVFSDLVFTGSFTAGNVSFAYKVSSYSTDYGVLEFLIDDVVVFTSAGGETGWLTRTQAITAGAHTLRWRFKNRLPFPCGNAIPAPPAGGNCADRAWLDTVSLPLVTAPAAPSGVAVSAGPGASVITVTFLAPANNGGATITGYTASCSASGQTTRTNTGAGSPIMVSNLTNGVAYTCTVAATNSVGTGSSSPASPSVTPTLGTAKPYDLNGDGKSDILWKNTDGSAYGWLMNGTTITSGAYLVNAGTGWSISHVADFNGDAKADVLWRHTDGSVAIWIMNGLSATSTAVLQGAGTGWSVSHVADLDGDGKADLLWRHTDGTVYIWRMNGTTVLSGSQLLAAGTGYSITHTADLNGDGKADLLWRHTDGTVYAWLLNGASVTGTSLILGAGTGYSITHAADLNGDGKADILWKHTDGTVYGWLMNGLSVTETDLILGAGTGYSITHTADLDGDGKADILWKHTDGTVFAWLMNGLSVSGTSLVLGANTGYSITHTPDLNGDGKADLLWKGTDGTVYAWLMNGGSPLSTQLLIGAGGGWAVSP